MTDMTPQEAYKFLLNDCESVVSGVPRDGDPPRYREQMCTALAVLRAHHVYFSRFKPGDEVWPIACDYYGPKWELMHSGHVIRIVMKDVGVFVKPCRSHSFPVSDCFPTRAEAEAEAERRNRDA